VVAVYLSEKHHAVVKWLAERDSIALGAVVRRLVERVIDSTPKDDL
jgi:hypothetical protein